jgi:uncharacterized protein YdhG (YjbR/CyaY superfamily)
LSREWHSFRGIAKIRSSLSSLLLKNVALHLLRSSSTILSFKTAFICYNSSMFSTDEYLDRLKSPQKAQLERIRKIVKQIVPEAQEVMSYGMPGFKYKQKYLIGYAAFKDHMSVFPTPGPIEAVKTQLDGYEFSKGTIQFTLNNPLSESIIQEILTHRLVEIAQS